MLRAGFIGFGRMGITHFSILNSHPSVATVAVCDQSRSMLNILKKYVDIATYSDYRKMVSESKLDFVVISTPSDSHSEIINYALENNLHVFAEKPFAMSAAEGIDSISRLNGKNIVNQVGYVNRFNEVFAETKKLLDEGVIGEIKTFSSEMYGATVLKDSKSSWRGKKKSGGGCLYEFASHCIDLVVYLLGPPEGVKGSVLQRIYSSGVEDLVSSTFLYKNGCTGAITVNWSDPTYRKPTNIVKISGTRGKIIADKHAYKIFLNEADPAERFKKGWNTRYLTDFSQGVRFYLRGNEFTRQLDYFVDCIQNGVFENISSFSDALKTDILMDQIRVDAEEPTVQSGAARETKETALEKTKAGSFWKRIFKS